MPEPSLDEPLRTILDRIVAGSHTKSDLATLRRALLVGGQGNVVQVGKCQNDVECAPGLGDSTHHAHQNDQPDEG